MERSLIRYHYLQRQFPIDCVAVLPVDLLAYFTEEDSNSTRSLIIKVVAKGLRALRLTRLVKLKRIWRNVTRGFPMGMMLKMSVLLESVSYFILMLFIAHWMACFWRSVPEWTSASSISRYFEESGDYNDRMFVRCTSGGPCEPGIVALAVLPTRQGEGGR